jgi:pimeloyl-ACP methyl ester carboxylesterase
MAVGLSLLGAATCVWGALCLMFWLGHWQLLYHPNTAITKTPATVGMPFEEIGLETTEAGVPQIKGWWIPAAGAHYTAVYFHGANGNLSDTVDSLARLHAAGVTVLAVDYRGYGQSQFVRPNEQRWREDAEAALRYLVATRHLAPGSILLAGSGLGADLALEIAAVHPDVAGVILDNALDAPTEVIFRDPRARLVPARLLVSDRWDLTAPATDLRIPSLWFLTRTAGTELTAEISSRVTSTKMIVWLGHPDEAKEYADAFSRWLDDLPVKH